LGAFRFETVISRAIPLAERNLGAQAPWGAQWLRGQPDSGGVTRPTALAGAQELDVAGMACVERGLAPPEVVMKLTVRLKSVGIPARPGSPVAHRPDDLEELAGEALEASVDWAQTKPWADAEAL
jgi:hypothetical protein